MLMLHHVVSCCLCTIILLHEAIASSNVKVNFDLNTVTPSGVGADQAVDGRTVTAWRLPDGQTTADLNATTTRPYTVNILVLTLTVTSAVPHSTRVSVIGDNVTWTVFINRTCNDTFYHWTSYSELTNCVVASRITEVRAPDNVFWARNESSGELVWRTTFTRAEMAIRGEESDFSNNNYNFFNISELQLFAFSDGGDTTNCNCDPTGVKSLRRPCNTTTGTCRCRRTRFHSDYDFITACRPEIIPLHRNITPYHGPLSGGTIVVFLGVFLRKPSSITVGDRYPCWENFTNNPYNDTGVVCITTAAYAEHLNISMPFHICWETSDVMSCIITHDEYTYRPEPSVTGLSRTESLAKGGLPITIYGHNFDSIYGYVGNPLIPLEHYPHIGIWVGKKVEGGPEFFELDRSRRRPVLCSVPNSNELTCRTPEVSVARNILEDLVSYKPNPVQLRVYLGTGSDILTNRNTSFRFPFVVYKNPTIKQWGSVQSFQIWDDQEIIRITGQDFRKCCSKNDYEVTVGGVHCPILVLQSNAMSCAPSKTKPEPTIFDRDGGSRVLLKVGSYEFVVGYLKYEVTWIDNDKNRTYVIGGACGLAGLILLIIIIVIVLVCYRRRKKRQQQQRPASVMNQYLYDEGAGRRLTPQEQFLEEIEDDEARNIVRRCLIPTSRLQMSAEIGKGNYGKVFKGKYWNNDGQEQDVAVKVAHSESIKYRLEFVMEAVLMADFDHPNVMWLIAIAIDNEMKPHVLLPLMEHGDLRSFVAKPTSDFLMKELVEFGLQVADGMDYLSARLVHRDLAARNCMVDGNRVVKVADFGLARFTEEKEYYRPVDRTRALPIKWMALESMTDDIFTTKSDVWSYGILLWELMTRGAKPYDGIEPPRMKRYLQDGNRLPVPSPMTPNFVYSLMQQCWDKNPNRRPSFSEIKTFLEGHLQFDQSNKISSQRDITEAAAYRPTTDNEETVPMRNLIPGSQRNDYLSLCESIPPVDGYLQMSAM